MNPFMGVYHYDGDMQYDDFRYNEIEDTALKYKLKIIRKFKPNLHICSPSKWLLEKSKNSKLFSQFPHYHIPYGIPLDIYKPINKNIALVHFGLEDKPTIMFSSISLATKRKGFHLLKKIIPDIINMGIQIVVAGKSSQKIDNVKYLGAINNENLMAMAYNTCDAYVLPSLQDNLPNTMLESLACAKPVITFNHFGMGEVVKEGLNGFLSNEITADGLLKSITRWVNFYKSKNNTDDFYSRIRLEVEQQFNQEKQLKMYLKVFEQV